MPAQQLLTQQQSQYLAWLLTRSAAGDSVESLASTLVDAQVELNPHQVDAALFACKNPLSRGVILRLFIFADRVEIISPGHLPDSLTPEQIRAGLSNQRNKVLAEHAAHILPYRGLGTGIPRALGAWPKIDLIDERDTNQFRAVVWREGAEEVAPEVAPEVLRMLAVIAGEMSRGEIMAQHGLKDEKHFRKHYQQAGISQGAIEMTIPDKPNSRMQKYRITPIGRTVATNKREQP